jgi:hypothetical protein
MTSTDKAKGDSSFIFYPISAVVGDKIYYSSYGNTTSNGKDIHVIELMSDGFWSKPQNLGNVINTPFDEDYPYLASDGVTLYFASKGHYSMGGFDIYRSVYNPIAKQWSAPENLGFPFSSPYDDFLFVPSDDETIATFLTNRNNASNTIDVVLVEIDESPIRRTITDMGTLHSIARLEPPTADKKEVGATGAPKDTPKPKTASFSAVENDPEYVRTLAKGFAEQMKADTARIQLEALRQKFDYISTAEERRKLEAQVVAMENKLLDSQRNADTFFAQASQIEQEYLTGKRKPTDKPTATFATDKPQFLYQAQFASTVFHTDELNRLAQTEKLAPQIESNRKQVNTLKNKLDRSNEGDDSTGEYQKNYSDYQSKLKSFNGIISGHLDIKKKLYRECISVAMVKSGAGDRPEIKSEIERANKHFRSATAIRNNATPDAIIESEYEALLLDELGVLRLEVAFAKLWGMKLFEQEVLSKLYRLEQNIFGKPLVVTTPEPAKPADEDKKDETQSHLIVRTEETLDAKPILFQPEEEPAFQVLEKSPYNSQNPIPSHLPLPQGVIYKIQLAAFSNPVAITTFKGMYPLSTEPVSGGKVTKYYTGMFLTLADAQKALPIVKTKGFKDAFVVAWHNGRSVPLSRAETLEKTEPAKPADTKVNIRIEKESHLYLVQIGTFKGRLPDDISQTVRALAPGKDIVRKPDNMGGFIYSISSFNTSTEATRVKDNLVASGLNNAMVIAVELEN